MPPPRLISSTAAELLTFFGKCPQCRYSATATETVLRYDNDTVDTRIYLSCGQPCGWTTQVAPDHTGSYGFTAAGQPAP
ncbi:hypothetical protein [Nocardia noduli]|uniref:hypothetical protein n=1 Tax=Nocardia noduli TaxID=2815722 RepID=UPI001C22419D|nr:hypothetical protein [Nocardia noduli]